MTITYDDNDLNAIAFMRFVLTNKHFQKYDNSEKYVLWIGDKDTYPTIEELYHLYLKAISARKNS